MERFNHTTDPRNSVGRELANVPIEEAALRPRAEEAMKFLSEATVVAANIRLTLFGDNTAAGPCEVKNPEPTALAELVNRFCTGIACLCGELHTINQRL